MFELIKQPSHDPLARFTLIILNKPDIRNRLFEVHLSTAPHKISPFIAKNLRFNQIYPRNIKWLIFHQTTPATLEGTVHNHFFCYLSHCDLMPLHHNHFLQDVEQFCCQSSLKPTRHMLSFNYSSNSSILQNQQFELKIVPMIYTYIVNWQEVFLAKKRIINSG